nr:hypothetical protein OG781_34840 [Streptomyces sp. NBC_00830]
MPLRARGPGDHARPDRLIEDDPQRLGPGSDAGILGRTHSQPLPHYADTEDGGYAEDPATSTAQTANTRSRPSARASSRIWPTAQLAKPRRRADGLIP